MKSYAQLPEGYRVKEHIDLQKDKKLMLLVNGIALISAIPLCLLLIPILQYLIAVRYADLSMDMPMVLEMLAGMVGYVILHELVHAVFMRHFCTVKVRFGFTGMYAYAGSDGYYCRKHYILIALAPVVIWGVVLAILNVVLPPSWFLPVYMIQLINLSGAGGDLYITWRFRKLPEDALIQDSGIAMTVYTREE